MIMCHNVMLMMSARYYIVLTMSARYYIVLSFPDSEKASLPILSYNVYKLFSLDLNPSNDEKEVMELHWNKNLPRNGLGSLISKVNHIALVVSDVGKSLWFYSEVLGFQQIRRPNFDRHGAWLTMGNVELHLILENPVVHSGEDLIVSHISVETSDIHEVLRKLKEMEIPFETNTSVPKGDERDGIVIQYFMRDPDGYYIELCNCQILTEFFLGDGKLNEESYMEGVKVADIKYVAKLAALAGKAKHRVMGDKEMQQILEKFDSIDGRRVVVDETKLQNLLKRTKVYGDVIQGETEASLREVLGKTNNNVPEAVAYIKAKHGDKQMFQPPTVYTDNEVAHTPKPIHVEQ